MKLGILPMILSGLALMTTACTIKASNSAPKDERKTYSQSEYKTDEDNLASTETSLQGYGLKFEPQDSADGKMRSVRWDMTFYSLFKQNNPDARLSDAHDALKNYVQNCKSFEGKYAGQFKLTLADGGTAAQELPSAQKADLDAKINWVEGIIAQIENNEIP